MFQHRFGAFGILPNIVSDRWKLPALQRITRESCDTNGGDYETIWQVVLNTYNQLEERRKKDDAS
jgi:hypothetical protein